MSNLADVILRGELPEYYCVASPGKSVIFYPAPYAPFEAYPRRCGGIDAYYFVSNAVYHNSVRLVKILEESGIPASFHVEGNYKKMLQEAGFMNRAVNTLCWTERYGTRFVLGALQIELELMQAPGRASKDCLRCGKCVAACPTRAITENGFTRSRCLRQHMETGELSDETISRLLGTQLLGCDICQRVCPLNAHIQAVPVPENILACTDLSALLGKLPLGRSEELAQLIGKNYAGKKKLLRLVINAAGNSGEREYMEPLRVLFASASTEEREGIAQALKKIGGR